MNDDIRYIISTISRLAARGSRGTSQYLCTSGMLKPSAPIKMPPMYILASHAIDYTVMLHSDHVKHLIRAMQMGERPRPL